MLVTAKIIARTFLLSIHMYATFVVSDHYRHNQSIFLNMIIPVSSGSDPNKPYPAQMRDGHDV
ncbi:MAG: hypothetical protein AB2603_12190 [Candidatus Thiodiazotropha endolucinida]